MAENAKIQSSTQLTSLTDALAAIDRMVEPVAASELALEAAVGFTLAADAAITFESGASAALRLTGARLRRIDRGLIERHGVKRVSIRAPRVLVVGTSRSEATCAFVAGAIEAEGGIAKIAASGNFEAALNQEGVDAVIAVSGDGGARDDANLRVLANKGAVGFDGVRIVPFGDIAFGNAGAKPVLLLPGKIEAALAGWLTIGRRLLARLSFRLIEEQPYLLELARPVISQRGFADIVAVRRRAAQAEPVVGDWTMQTFARSDGWILVPAESDGHPAGAKVAMRPWP